MFDIITRILGIAGGLCGGVVAIWVFCINRKLKIYEVDEKIKLLDIKKKELESEVKKEKERINNDCGKRGIYYSGARISQLAEVDKKMDLELKKIEAHLEHLIRVKKIRWPWQKA